MRQLFIDLFDKLVIVLVALMLLGAFLAGIGALFAGDGGFLTMLLIWFGGAIYAIILGGSLFLILGIHDNTRRAAEALERLENSTARKA